MKNMALCDAAGRVILAEVMVAQTLRERLGGLLVLPPLRAGQGLLLLKCGSIHTVGMRYALDIVFLDRTGLIKKIVQDLRPLRQAGCWRAAVTLELPAGAAQRLGLQVGQQLRWNQNAPVSAISPPVATRTATGVLQ